MNIWPARIVLIATLDPWLFLNFIGFRFLVLLLGEGFGNSTSHLAWFLTSPDILIRDKRRGVVFSYISTSCQKQGSIYFGKEGFKEEI